MINQGWECPKCHTIYAPTVSSCDCKKQQYLEKHYLVGPGLADPSLAPTAHVWLRSNPPSIHPRLFPTGYVNK